MFGVGLGELTVIVVIAVLVFGPDKVPELASQAGRLVRQLRKMANDARDDLRTELGPEFADLELRDLDPREIVRKQIAEAMADDDKAASESKAPRALAPGETPPWDPDAT